MDRFTASSKVIDSILLEMKKNNYIDPEAKFNYNSISNLRSEVTYRDSDFLSFLGYTELEECFVDELTNYLVKKNVIDSKSTYNKNSFLEFRKEVKSSFSGTWTSISPVMERVIYMLTSIKQPKNILELGSFWGNTLAWFAGPCIGKSQQYQADSIIGVDIDKNMCEKAVINFSKIANTEKLKIVNGNALDYVSSLDTKIDFLYLEAKTDEQTDLYLKLLKLIENKLSDNVWIIAHDIYDKDQMHDFDEYLEYVRNSENFKQSISLDVDSCGMELTIKGAK